MILDMQEGEAGNERWNGKKKGRLFYCSQICKVTKRKA